MNCVLWGCCWFNESVDVLIDFLNQTSNSFKSKNIKVILLVFVANTSIKNEDILKLKTSVNDVIILKNNIDIYPNKNYGVYSIVSYAHKKRIKYVAVVDPDWSIEQSEVFIDSIILPIINKESDIVIPNIGAAAGRANKIIGRAILELLYPDYKDTIITPFPGSFSALTQKIYPIVNSKKYHFDWGGEWDIISYAIKKNTKIKSVPVDVENVRHRNNKSKTHDSYQIWRAVFSNNDIVNRYENILKYSHTDISDDKLYRIINESDNSLNSSDIILKLENMDLDSTERQLLYMILYPLHCLINNQTPDFMIIEDPNTPYNKEKIDIIMNLAILYAQTCLKNSNVSIKKIYKNANTIGGSYFGTWDKKSIRKSKKEMNKQIKELL